MQVRLHSPSAPKNHHRWGSPRPRIVSYPKASTRQREDPGIGREARRKGVALPLPPSFEGRHGVRIVAAANTSNERFTIGTYVVLCDGQVPSGPAELPDAASVPAHQLQFVVVAGAQPYPPRQRRRLRFGVPKCAARWISDTALCPSRVCLREAPARDLTLGPRSREQPSTGRAQARPTAFRPSRSQPARRRECR